jgi:hypothetical protein
MIKGGWTPEQIDKAVTSVNRIDAINKETNSSATRYVNPDTGKSVVIDNATNEVIHVGRKDDFQYGPESGDVPGAVMRPPPSSGNSPGGASAPSRAPGSSPIEDPVPPIEPLL